MEKESFFEKRFMSAVNSLHTLISTAFEPGTIADALDILVTFIFNKTEAIPKTKVKIKETQQKLKENDQANNSELEYELCYLQGRLTNMQEIDVLISEGYSVDRDFLDLTSF